MRSTDEGLFELKFTLWVRFAEYRHNASDKLSPIAHALSNFAL